MNDEIQLSLHAPGSGEIESELTLDPKKSEPQLKLTEAEQKQVDEFAKTIDLSDSSVILQYGVGAQKKISSFSEKTLNSVRTKDLGEVGELLSDVVVELKSFENEEEKGIKGFLKRSGNKIEQMKAKYDKAEKNVDDIARVLENHQITLMKDISMLDQMYDLNEKYFKEISMYIMAGNQKLDDVRNRELPALMASATEGSLDAQKANDLQNMANRFEKKLHDLELTRMVSLQMAPQIRMVQTSNMVMAEKIQSTIVNTIPIWKNQMVLALGVHHSEQAAAAQKTVADLTNQLLKKNAETLRQSTVHVARESERGVIDVETLRYTNEQLISALDEVRKIQLEGQENRAKAQTELENLEQELKHRLLPKADA